MLISSPSPLYLRSPPPNSEQLPITAAWLIVGCPGNRIRLARLQVRRLDHYTKRHQTGGGGGRKKNVSNFSQMVGDWRNCQQSTFENTIGWLRCDANNNRTAFVKAPNKWPQIEYSMCGRRAAWSPLWWWPCYWLISFDSVWTWRRIKWKKKLTKPPCDCCFSSTMPFYQVSSYVIILFRTQQFINRHLFRLERGVSLLAP